MLGVSAANSTLVTELLHTPLSEVGKQWMIIIHDTSESISMSFLSEMNLATILWTIALTLTLYAIYIFTMVPYNRVRTLGDLGYIPEGQRSMKDMANIVRRRRKIGSLPPVYPNGWFCILEAQELKKGQVKQVNSLGLTLAVYRGVSNEIHAIDAYCPHLGANLAVGGRIKGNCIECPFHGWLFDGATGKCTEIPYSNGKIPDQAKVKSYNTLERNGNIYLWYHAEGAEPDWEPPVIEEIENGTWKYSGRTEHDINCHVEEVSENGADPAHLPQVHSAFMTSGIDLRHMWSKVWGFAKHSWEANWAQHTDPSEKHIGSLNVIHTAQFFGFNIPMLNFKVTANQIGPGIVYMFFEGFTGKGVYLHHITPVEPLLQHVLHHVYIPWYQPTLIGMFYMISEAIQIERDITIWNNKLYAGKPIFVKSVEDQTLAKHRRWYSQFYSENSPKFSFQKDTLEF